MAGGKYDKLAGKTRPGTYINFESDRNDTVGNSERGIVLLPLIGYDFGPAKTPITLTAAAPDAYSVELGRSVYDATNDKMRLIREAFKKASKVIVYITESGTAATGTAAPLTVTAKYGGTRGNDIHVSVVTNPVGGFDVTVYLDADATAVYEGVKTVEELIAAAADDKLVKFLGDGTITALVVQDPFRMGYDGIKTALAASKGETVPANVDTGANLITKDNMNSERAQELLNPKIN